MASNLDDTFEEFYKEKFEGYIDLFVERCRTAVEESDQDFIEWLLKVVEHNKEMWCAIWKDKHFYENPEMIEMIYREVCKNELKIEGAKILGVQGGKNESETEDEVQGGKNDSETEDSHWSADDDSTHGSDGQGGDSEDVSVASEQSGATQTRHSPRLAGADPENKGLMVIGMMAMLAQGK